MKRPIKIKYDAPITLSFAILSFIILSIDSISNSYNGITSRYFTLYYTGFHDFWQYIRLFTHCIGHANFQHYFGNMLFILLLGPIIEEKYGSKKTFIMIMLTSFISGLLHLLLNPNTGLLGASGIVFMLILLSAYKNYDNGYIPLSFLLVTILWIGQEIYSVFFVIDNISRIGHIIGGICGGMFGFFLNKKANY